MPLAILLLLPVLVDLVRRPSFRNLAVRNIARRRGEAMLVIVGAMLGTAIITASFVIGDTITQSIRDSARTTLGPVDVVLRTTGEAVVGDLQEIAEGTDGVDATATIRSIPGVLATAGTDPLAEPSAVLIEGDLDQLRGLGDGGGETGFEDAGATPTGDEVLVHEGVAEDLGLREGDAVELFAFGTSVPATVRTIVPEVGVAGYAPSNGTTFGTTEAAPVFVAAGTIDALRAAADDAVVAAPPSDEVLLSLDGGVFDTEPALDGAAASLVDELGDLDAEVGEVKRDLLDAAQQAGDSIGQLYLGIGGFSVIAGILLLVNLFVMLSEERKTELGMLRAIGLKRNHLMRTFAIEGAIYAVVAAIAGGILGIGVGAGIITLASGIMADAGADFTYRLFVDPVTLSTGIGIGLAISMVTVWSTSLRISRLNVIRAIRDLPEPTAHEARLRTMVLAGFGVLAGIGMLQAGLAAEAGVPTLAGPPIAFFSAIPLLARVLSRRGAILILSTAALVYSVLVFNLFPDQMGEVGIETFVVQGVLLVGAAVAILSSADGFWKGMARLLARSGAGLSPRLGLAYPLARKFRTGMLLGMYSLVIFTMTFLSVFSALLGDQAPTITEEVSAGHDIFLDSNAGNPVTAAQLLGAPDVVAVAALEPQFARFVTEWVDEPTPWAMTGFDEDLLALGSAPKVSKLAEGYATEEEAYRAVLADPTLALVPDFFLAGGGGPPEGTLEAGDTFVVVAPDGTERTLTAAGIVANDWVFNGVFVSGAVMDELFGAQAVPSRFFVAVDESADAEVVAARLSGAFIPNGVDARTFTEEVGDALAAQQGFFSLMNGYLGLGLLIGIAGLGVVMVRAVRERRRQIGMLRAMGFPSSVVRRSFLLEAAFIALQGSLLGIGLGLVTSWQVLSAGDLFGEGVSMVVPLGPLAVIFLVPFVASLLATLAPAAQAAAIRPAVALRIAD